MITVGAIQCPKCKDIIYSRAVHDFHGCSCSEIKGESTGVTIDGGLEYCHIGWSNDIKVPPDIIQIQVDATPKQLFDDWNKREDKFGKIKWVNQGVDRGAI